ncbi:ATP-dependent DNA helicase DinG [Litchfieldia salsa]|uniref:3'-5' exonuclease DinG n=1 Tax=Litchfieldia salsa TaxID=930152 RepID=A0A1H0TKA4_9BACI|nr:ATP-dependent DNA helicase DinG [Litchfieldia salsa]SDP54439.1 ATP-dependent DNA helicase DinG [Litchfieldia salsa]
MNNRFVVIDIETTGNSPKKGDRIIQFAAVVIIDGEIVERFSSFINPNRKIPTFIEQLTGISNEIVEHAPDFKMIAPEIVSMLEDSYFVAHNVPFDLSFLQTELENHGFPTFSGPTIDTVELSRIMMPTIDSYKLSYLAGNLELSHIQPHRADSDAEVTAELLLRILDKLNDLPLVTCQKLLSLSRGLKSDLDLIIGERIEKKISKINNDDLLFDIFRGIALKKENVETVIRTKGINYEEFKKYNVENNNGITFRPEQIEMMDFVTYIQETNQHGLIEGGTGIGKTLAYLIPSILLALNKDKPVIVSTNTIQLQQQLLENDIPLVSRLLPIPFTYALLKGKTHYLSLRKFEQSLYELDNNYDTVLTKCQILVWLTETTTADVEEINLPSGGQLFWARINIDSTYTVIKDDPWQSRCFYEKAKERAKQSNIVITNHALLLSDLTSEKELLPDYEFVVIDEGHHIEQIASKHFGERINYLQIIGILSQLGTLDNNQLIAKSAKIFRTIGEDIRTFSQIDTLLRELKVNIDELFSLIKSYVIETSSKVETNRISYQFRSKLEQGHEWEVIRDALSSIMIIGDQLKKIVDAQMHVVNQNSHMITPFQQGTVADYYTAIRRFIGLLNNLNSLLFEEREGVTWFEGDWKGAKNATTIYSQPIDVSELLADKFFTHKKSVLLTSATLTVRDSFGYMIDKLGLKDFQPLTLKLNSPFDFKSQAVIMIPNDLPDLNNKNNDSEFVEALSKHLIEIVLVTKGRMLVLFTSTDMLKKSYHLLKQSTHLNEYMIIAQGISGGSKAKLTKNFKAFDKSILLGTNSFWEGVDITGDQLTTVVIVRLPFTPPNEPLYKAKSEKVEKLGGNSFTELALPEAVMRFKQGFGRLIRTEKDKGIVFVMDQRITTTHYGKQFLSSLPEVTVIENQLDVLLEKVDKWLS